MYTYINWSSCLSHHLWGIGTQIKGAAHLLRPLFVFMNLRISSGHLLRALFGFMNLRISSGHLLRPLFVKGVAHYETKLKINNGSFLQTYALVYFNNTKKWSQ
jgi:hypothetical protein